MPYDTSTTRTLRGYDAAREFCRVIGDDEALIFEGYLPREIARTKDDHGRRCVGTFDEHLAELQSWEAEGRSVYLHPNPGGTKKGEITSIRAVSVEFDAPGEGHKRAQALPSEWHLEPTAIVQRGASVQCHWRVSDCPVAEFRTLQMRLQRHYQSDGRTIGEWRLWRVPGFKHPSHQDQDVELVIGELAEITGPYSIASLSDGVPALPLEEPREPSQPTGEPVPVADLRSMLAHIDPTFSGDDGAWIGIAKAVWFDELPVIEHDVDFESLCDDWCSGKLWRERTGDQSFDVVTYHGAEELRARISDGPRDNGQKIGIGTIWKLARDGGYPGGRPGLSLLDRFDRVSDIPDDADEIRAPAKSAAKASNPHVSLLRLGDIEIKAVQWLVPGWVALGVLQIIAGKPGDAKTTLAISLGAVITNGGMLPDGEWTDALGDILLWSGEDPRDTVLAPRFLAAGADPDRVHIVGEVSAEGAKREFDPATDMALLYAAAEKIPNLKLVIVDPVIVMVAGDSNQSNQVRRGLQPLRDFAERFNCAVIGITHFRKAGRDGETGDILSRVLGSQAFTAAARLVLVTARRPDDSERILIRAKSNLGPDGGGFVYKTAQEPVPGHPEIKAQIIQWGETLEGRPAELMASFEKGESKRLAARAWLSGVLREAAGPVPIDTIKKRAAVELKDTSWDTIKRAATGLGLTGKEQRRSSWGLESRLSDEIDFGDG